MSLTINGYSGKGTVFRPYQGAASARVTILEDETLQKGASIVVKINDTLVFTGTARDVTQNGGLFEVLASDAPKGVVAPLLYDDSDVKRILTDILRMVGLQGEINTNLKASTYARLRESSMTALNRVCACYGLIWRTQPNGTVVVQPLPTRGKSIIWGEEMLRTRENNGFDCLLRPDVVPGQTLTINPYEKTRDITVHSLNHIVLSHCQETQLWAI